MAWLCLASMELEEFLAGGRMAQAALHSGSRSRIKMSLGRRVKRHSESF